MMIWLTFNSVAILILTGLLYLTVRQLGILLARSGPVGARHAEGIGPRIGENIRSFVEPLADGAELPARPGLYAFLSNACAVCTVVEKAAIQLGLHWHRRVNIFLIYDGAAPQNEVGYRVVGRGVFMLRHPDVRERLSVNAVPHAVMVDAEGVVLGHGIVNAISHLESLLELTDPEVKADSANGHGRPPTARDGERRRRRSSTWDRERMRT